jgi:hypothetical protein
MSQSEEPEGNPNMPTKPKVNFYDQYANDITDVGYASFSREGDTVEGTVQALVSGTDFNDNPCPELHVEVGEGRIVMVTCGLANLKTQILQLEPQIGDRIKIVYVEAVQLKGGRVMKKFDVTAGPF